MAFSFGLRIVWIVLTTPMVAYVLVPDIREVLPPMWRIWTESAPLLGLILDWPETRLFPLAFVGAIVAIDLVLLITALRSGPRLQQVLERKPSASKVRDLLKFKEYRKAAETLALMGQAKKGAKLLRDRGHLVEAAQLLIDHEKPGQAEALLKHIEPSDALTAADMLERCGRKAAAKAQYARAAEYFAERREMGKAGRCYYLAGEVDAARTFLSEGWQEVFRPDGTTEVATMLLAVGLRRDAGLAFARTAACATSEEDALRLTKRAAVLLAKAGDPLEGAKLLEHRGQADKAAELYAHAGEIDKAVELLLSIKAAKRAAEILLKVDQHTRAIDILVDAGENKQAAELALGQGDVRRGAALLERSGDIDEAVQLLEESGEFVDAAEMVRLSGDEMRAASLYERGGDLKNAAAIYAALGDELRAASLYAKGGGGAAAARIFLKNGRIREASTSLAGVVSDETRPMHAELGVRFSELGESGQALEHFMAAIAGQPLVKANIPVYYHLGTLYEQLGDDHTALSIYQSIYALNPYVEGLAIRMQAVHGRTAARPPLVTGVELSEMGGGADPRYSETVGLGAVAAESGQTPPADKDDRYELIEEMGRGAMGRVMRAFDKILQRELALKLLPESLSGNHLARSAFLAEARAAAALRHPNIVTLYDVGTRDNVPYIAMELVDGGDLGHYMESQPGVTLAVRLRLLAEVAAALEAAHNRGIVHRDVKPSNILVDQDQHVRLVDFGIARARGSIEATDGPVGTPYYMSPEQAQGLPVDHRTDIYSFGVVLFEICSGRLPFLEGNVMQHHISTPPPSVRTVSPFLPPALDELIASCLEKQPENRPEDAAAVRAAIEQIAEQNQ